LKAVVMAGGHGTRLRPLTSNLPKPMMPVANIPTAHHILDLLAIHGINDVVMTVAFLPQMIRNYFGDGSDFEMNVEYSVEDNPLGTAGSVKAAQDHLDETFIVISGDALTDIDLTAVIRFHRERGALATFALVRVENPLEFGVIIMDEQGRIERFLEKPGWGQVFSDTVNTGIYVLEPEVLDEIPPGVSYDFSHELFPALHERGAPLYGSMCEGYWQDIGTIEQYQHANRDALDGRVRVNIPGVRLRGNVWVGQGVNLDSLENVVGPAVIGNYAKIDPSAVIGPHTVLGNNVILRPGAQISDSVVGESCYLGEGSRVRGAVLGNSVDLRTNVVISEGAVIGDQCSIEDNALIGNNIKIYPFKTVEAGASVKSSIISEVRGMTTLFGQRGVRGLINVDITPERAMRLAMSYGTLLRKDAMVTATRDSHPASRMLKRAMIAGLTSTGVSVRDLQVAPLAVNRFDLKNASSQGGIHIRISPHHPEEVEIILSEPPGLPLSEQSRRTIENYFHREDFRRAYYDEMGQITYPAHTLEMYTEALVESVNAPSIRARNLRVVVDYSYSPGSKLLGAILDRLGVETIGVNAFSGISGAFRLAKHLPEAEAKVKRLVDSMEADLGLILDPGGEQVFILDDAGHTLSPNELLLLLLGHVCVQRGKGSVVLPLHATGRAEEVAERCGATVSRTRSSDRSVMEEASAPQVIFAATANGGLIFPSFLPTMDAFLTAAMVVEMVAGGLYPLSQLAAEVPVVHLDHDVVCCPWQAKGAAMRMMVEELRNEAVSLVDGIKVWVNQDEWVQILPDADEPLFHVYAEGRDDERAEGLLRDYTSRLDEVIGKARTAVVR